MTIPTDLKNIPVKKYKKLPEDLKEMLRILIAFVVMALIFGMMLISTSVSVPWQPQPAVREVIRV